MYISFSPALISYWKPIKILYHLTDIIQRKYCSISVAMKKITADPILDVFSVPPKSLKTSLSLLTLAHRQRNYLGTKEGNMPRNIMKLSSDFSRDPPIMGPPWDSYYSHTTPNPECLEIMYPMGSREIRTWGGPVGDPIGLGGFWKNSFKLP